MVQAANLWQAERVAFSFAGKIRVEMTSVGDRRDWLEELVPLLLSGRCQDEPESFVLQKALWSAFAKTGGSAVLAASGPQGEEPRAVRLGLDDTTWGRAQLEPNSFLIQIEPDDLEYLKTLEAEIVAKLERYVCSDRTQVLCGREIKAFLPISPRADWEKSDKESGMGIGLWAWGDELGIPIERSFQALDAHGVQRRELTFGVFRTCLVNKAEKARSVVVFSQHLRPIPSRVVWLWQGVEVCHQDFDWEPDQMAVTLYLEAPVDVSWDISQREFRWEERLDKQLRVASADLKPSLEMLVKEYNSYSPRVESSTLGCWGLMLAACLAIGGVGSLFMGGRPAVALALVAGLVLMIIEYRDRHGKRLAVGHGLKNLVSRLETDPSWRSPMHVDGGAWGSSSSSPGSP